MEITYRTKQKYNKGFHGVGIEVEYKNEDGAQLEKLRSELVALGYDYRPSPFPKNGSFGHKCRFGKAGSYTFGLQTTDEYNFILKESLPILKKYDNKVTKTIFLYDNN